LGQIISNRITTTDRRRVKEEREEFYSLWQFPNCIGDIDGKHIEIQAPHSNGSLLKKKKKTFSVVLLALVDANYKFNFQQLSFTKLLS
jgi:hypothetical protein